MMCTRVLKGLILQSDNLPPSTGAIFVNLVMTLIKIMYYIILYIVSLGP